MKTLILFALILSSNVFAADHLIKTLDGTVARCKTKLDQVDHNISAVYRPLEVQKTSSLAFVTIEFLRCTDKGFMRDQNIASRTVRPIINPEYLIEVTRSKFSLIAMNGRGDLIDKKTLTMNNDGTFSAGISTIAANHDNSPTGRQSIEIMVQSFVEVKDKYSGVVLDRYFETLGSYRLVIR